jgi:hypothetical protein
MIQDYPWRLPEQRFTRRPFERSSSWYSSKDSSVCLLNLSFRCIKFWTLELDTIITRSIWPTDVVLRHPLQPYTPFQIHHVHDSSSSGATLNPRQRREDTGLTDEEFREAMNQLRKQEYRPPDPQKQQGGRGILRTRSATPPSTTEEEKACTVCLETFLPGEQVAITPCNHMFHQGCIAPWVKGHGNCPVCRFALCERRNPADAANEDGGMDLELLAMVRAMEEAFSRFRLFSDSTPHYH